VDWRRRIPQHLVASLALIAAAIFMTIGATEAALSQPAAGWFTAAGWMFGSALLLTLMVEARARHSRP
jgi:hypothetical protein